MKKFFQEFKKFILRGNVFDMAVGLIIASSFNKIVSSMVSDIIMPLITWSTGASSLADLSIPLRYEIVDGVKVVTLSWAYGNFIQTVIDFLIVAFSLFVVIKIVNVSRDKIKDFNEDLTEWSSKEYKSERKRIKLQAKQEGRKFKELWAEHLENKKKLQEEQVKIQAEEKAKKEAEERILNPTQEDLLKEIRDLLKEQSKKEKALKK